MTMTDHTELDATIAALGLEYRARFVPQSESRNAKEEQPSLNWSVTITRGRQTLTTDYMQGIAHLPEYNRLAKVQRTKAAHDYLRSCASTGKYSPVPEKAAFNSFVMGAKPIPAPLLRDVLYCLVMDAGVLDYSTFEQWAGEYGYDTDSRKAEATYRACLEIALQLRAIVGDDGLRKLQEAFQDY
jgi:hypothetical protein